MARIRARRGHSLRGVDWPDPEDELDESVPLERYTSKLARWAAQGPHWFVNGFKGQPWPGDGSTYDRAQAIRDLERAHEWEDAVRSA